MNESKFEVNLEFQAVKITVHGVPDRPGIAAEIFQRLSQEEINVELVVQSPGGGAVTDISLAVIYDDFQKTKKALEVLISEIGASGISKDENVALITLAKYDLSKIPGVAARMFRCLANQNINIDLISTSLSNITCIIGREGAASARQALCDEFGALI